MRSSVGYAGEPMTRLPSTLASIASSRLVATGRSSAVMASPVGAPTARSPVVDMMEQAVRKRSGWLIDQRLGDHAAHGGADHVRPGDARARASSAAASSAMSSTR